MNKWCDFRKGKMENGEMKCESKGGEGKREKKGKKRGKERNDRKMIRRKIRATPLFLQQDFLLFLPYHSQYQYVQPIYFTPYCIVHKTRCTPTKSNQNISPTYLSRTNPKENESDPKTEIPTYLPAYLIINS